MKHYITILLKVFAGVLTTAAFITLAVKIVTAYNSGAYERKQILDKVTTVEAKVDGLNVNVRQLNEGQEDMRGEINVLSQNDNNIKRFMMETAARRGDIDELMNLIKIWGEDEKKKNGLQIPLVYPEIPRY